jgi:hypothetical protein
MMPTKARNRNRRTPYNCVHLNLRCSCGSTLSGLVSPLTTDVMRIRDIFLSFHRTGDCVVIDKSVDVTGEVTS